VSALGGRPGVGTTRTGQPGTSAAGRPAAPPID